MAPLSSMSREMMRQLPVVALMVAVLSGAISEARAQSGICRQIAAELAALPSGDSGRGAASSRQVNQMRVRLGQVQGQMAGLGCNRGFVLFGSQPPAECSGLRAEAASLQGSISQLSADAGQGGSSRRRMQLMASYDANNCRSGGNAAETRAPARVQVDPEPRRSGPAGFLESLFGGRPDVPRYATPENQGLPADDPGNASDDDYDGSTHGGNLPICVRTCDGFFFPVNYRGASDQYEDVCRASCPGAETRIYWMRAGADLDTAHTRDGQPYSSMPAAFGYRKSIDASCSCKTQQQTWGSVLQKAEALIKERGTVTVTEEYSLKMSRPGPAQGLRGLKTPEEKPGAESRAAQQAADQPATDAAAEPKQKPVRVVAPNTRARPKTPQETAAPAGQ